MFKKLIDFFRSKNKKVSRVEDEWLPQANATPEDLCGIDPLSMSKEAIRKRLALLYKRHNDAVSSLNPDLRKEADIMLDAIIECREKYLE